MIPIKQASTGARTVATTLGLVVKEGVTEQAEVATAVTATAAVVVVVVAVVVAAEEEKMMVVMPVLKTLI